METGEQSWQFRSICNAQCALLLGYRFTPRNLGYAWEKIVCVHMESPSFCLIFSSVAWNYSKSASALYLGFDFFLTGFFLTLKFQIKFLFVSSSKFAVTLSSFFFQPSKSYVVSDFLPSQNFPCFWKSLHVFENLRMQSYKISKGWVWTFFHSLSWHPHGPVQFWNLIFGFSLETFSSVTFFFFFNDFFFPFLCFYFLIFASISWTSQINFLCLLTFISYFILFLLLIFT